MSRTEKNKELYKELEKQKKRFLHSYAFYKEMSIRQIYGTHSAFRKDIMELGGNK
jgi:hypothetical protein